MGDVFDQVAPAQKQQTPQVPNGQSQGDVFDQVAAQNTQNAVQNDPSKTRDIVNDVGNKVIVPKEGESFEDTMKRAIQYHNSLTDQQKQEALNKEMATIPAKTAQTLGAAATIGAVGPAVMALPGKVAEAVPSVLAHTVDGVKAIGAWASKNPVQAYLLFQLMKELVPGAKKAMGIAKGAPDAE